MILPNDIEPIAKSAYLRFVKSDSPETTWEELPEAARTVWRDRVVSADKMRKHSSLEIWEDDCALAAIRRFEGIETAAPAVTVDEEAPAKPAKPKKGK